MMAGHLSLSGTIWVLARTPFTQKIAINLIKTKLVPVFVKGIYNTVLTALRAVLLTLLGISIEFGKGYTSDRISRELNKYIDTCFWEVLSCLGTWGGIISLMADIMDGKFDGYITI